MISEARASILPGMLPSKRFWGVLLAASLVACGPDRDVKDPVGDREVMGLWVVSLDTLEILRRDGFVPDENNPLYVNLHPNGSCGRFSAELDWNTGKPKVFLSSVCRWKHLRDAKIGANARQKNLIELRLEEGQGERSRHLHLGRRDGELFLWEFYGDPDNGEYVEYVRNFVRRS